MSRPFASSQAKRELRRRATLRPGHLLEAFDQNDVLLEILLLKSRETPTHVVLFQLLRVLHSAAQETAAKRAEGNEPDPQLTTRGQHRRLGLAGPQGVFTLQRRDRVGPAGPANRPGPASERPRKRTLPSRTSSAIAPTVSSIGRVRVDPVKVVQIDHVHTEAARGWLRMMAVPARVDHRRLSRDRSGSGSARTWSRARPPACVRESLDQRASRSRPARTRPPYPERSRRDRGRDGSCAPIPRRRLRRSSGTCPCSPGRSLKPSIRCVPSRRCSITSPSRI